MKKIEEHHRVEFEDRARIVVKVPGIYTFLGEFADYCKGFTLCGAAPLYLEVAVSPREDQSVRLYMATHNDRKRFNLQNTKYKREDRWANYIKGVLSVLNARGYSVGAFNLTLSGELLHREGTMTNSAIVLGVTLALSALYNLKLSPEECATVAYSALSTFANEECRLIIFLAMLNVTPDSLLLYDIQYLKYEKIKIDDLDDSVVLLIVESKIAPQALQEELSIRREESKAAFKRLRSLFPSGLMRDILEQDIKENEGQLTEEEKRICHYVLSESRLAREGGRLLAQKDMVGYGKVL
ncbi:MAG: galactokinase family protein, partial [Sphaerochaetaceae bacterium]